MTGCLDRSSYCIEVTSTTTSGMWAEIRSEVGPTIFADDWQTQMNSDIQAYDNWVAANGPVPFDKWLLWKIRVGTDEYGNLPKNNINSAKVGNSWSTCPYSTQSSELRTRHMLGLSSTDPLPTKVDHSIGNTTYYLSTRGKGPRWGFECSYAGCTHFILTGEQYFYI